MVVALSFASTAALAIFDPDDVSGRVPQAQSAVRDSGARMYAGICSACHQLSGQGLGDTIPPLAESEWVTGSVERLVRILLHGVTGEIEVQGEMFNAAMPPWGPTLKDYDVAAVATYIRSNWGHRASAVSDSTVRRIREATRDRQKPWTQEELRRIR